MLLHCGSEEDTTDAPAARSCWLGAGTLESLAELNELALVLLGEQPLGRGASSAWLQPLIELCRSLDAPARRRAAACPYLLLDAGFGDPARWRPASGGSHIGDAGTADRYSGCFTQPGGLEVARLVFTYAWHLTRSQPPAARLLLGMPAASVAMIGRLTLRQIQALAESHPGWLRPRWPARLHVWRELLLAAASGEALALERARLRGVTLLAGEARLAAGRADTAAPETPAPLLARA